MSPLARDHPATLATLIAVQSFCAAFFLWDVANDLGQRGINAFADLHLAIEAGAALALLAAIGFEARYLMALLRRKAHLEDQVSIATGAFHDIILAHFDRWALTPAESDVAMFVIKGFSISETAELRGSAPGTVKAQLNAVYRKAGVAGRGALLGLLVDELLAGPLVTTPPAGQ